MFYCRKVSVNRILCTTGQGIGNCVQKTPAIKALREIYPSAEIDFLVHPNQEGIFDGWEVINKCLTQVPSEAYELVVHFTPPFWGEKIKGTWKTIEISRAKLMRFAEWDANLKAVLQLKPGFVPKDIHPYFPSVIPEGLEKAEGEKWIAICPGAGTEWLRRKDYGPDKWGKVVDLLSENSTFVFCILGAGEDDRKIREYLPKNARIIDCIDRYTIQESAGVLSLCDIMVGNDTSFGHIASALKIPSVVFFGASAVKKNRPMWGCRVISRRLPCSIDCQYTRKGCEEAPCRDIEPSVFADKVVEVLDGKDKPEEYKYGVWMTTHNRYPFLCATLKSIVEADIPEGWKFFFLDDNSDDKRIIPLIEQAADALRRKGCEVEIKEHEQCWGKDRYGDTVRECFDALLDCRFLVPIQDDFLLHRDFFKAAEKASEYLGGRRQICYMILHDAKSGNYRKIGKGIGEIGTYHEWWPAVWHPDLWKTCSLLNRPCFNGSGSGRLIAKQMIEENMVSLRLSQSAGIHLGEKISALNTGARVEEPLEAINPCLFGTLEILGERNE